MKVKIFESDFYDDEQAYCIDIILDRYHYVEFKIHKTLSQYWLEIQQDDEGAISFLEGTYRSYNYKRYTVDIPDMYYTHLIKALKKYKKDADDDIVNLNPADWALLHHIIKEQINRQ
jgi:hypothetical protein